MQAVCRGVRWQPQVERRWLAGLLASKQKSSNTATGAFQRQQRYIGRRGGAREREGEAWNGSGEITEQAKIRLNRLRTITVIHSGKIMQTWKKKGHKPRLDFVHT